MKKYCSVLFLLGCILLTGCSHTASSKPYTLYPIEETVDAAYLLSTETVPRETEDLKNKYQYDTTVTDKDGTVLSEMKDGKWHISENGEQIYGLLSEITENGVVGPNVTYAVDLDRNLTADCMEILQENGLDGCIIVSDLYGKICTIADYTTDTEYYADGDFKISAEHDRFSTLLEKDETAGNYILHHESGAEDEIIPVSDMYVGHTGRTYHSDGIYFGSTAKLMSSIVLLDLGASFTDTSYYDSGVINYGYNKNIYNHNYPNSMYPAEHNMRTSLINSYNTFFASAYGSIANGTFYEDFHIENNSKLDSENGFRSICRIMNRYFGFNEFGSLNAGYLYPCDWADLRQPSLNAIGTARENAKDREFLISRMAIGMCSDGQVINDKPTGNYFDASPLFLNAVTSAIATGDMYRFHLKSDADTVKLSEMEYNDSQGIADDSPDYTGSQIESIPLEYRQALWDGMKHIMPYTYQDYTAYVKTGTADDGSSFKRFILTGFVTKEEEPTENPQGWAVTLYIHNGTELNSEFASGYSNVYQQILRCVIGGASE